MLDRPGSPGGGLPGGRHRPGGGHPDLRRLRHALHPRGRLEPPRGGPGRRSAGGRRAPSPSPSPSQTGVAELSQYLFVSGALLLLFAFVAAVALTTLLATARQTLTAQPAVASASRPRAPVAQTVGPARPRGRAGRRDAGGHRPRPHLGEPPAPGGQSRDTRRHRGPRAVGQHVRVLHRLRGRHPGRLPPARASLRHPLAGLPAPRRGALPGGLRRHAAGHHRAARAGPRQRPAADRPRGHGHDRLRRAGHLLRGRRGLPGAGRGRPLRLAARSRRCSTRWPIAPSSSASRSSPR